MKKTSLFFVIAIGLFVFSFDIASAVWSGGPIVPCAVKKANQTAMCTLCDLFVGIKNIIDFGFYILVGASILIITVAGVIYIVSAGNTKTIETAKTAMKNTLIGFSVFVLGWLIINTVIFYISSGSNIQAEWGKFDCGAERPFK